MKTLALTFAVASFMLAQVATADSGYVKYQVKAGDTPATIASATLKDAKYFPQLMKYNRISHPSELKVGMEIMVPYSVSAQRAAQLTMSFGSVKVIQDGQELAAQKGLVLLQGAQVQTTAGAKVEIQLDEGSVVRVGPNTRFSLSAYAYNSGSRNTGVDLQNGSMNMRVTKLTGESQFKVSTVTAVAGVRGTYFYINYDENSKEVGLAVYSGEVEVGKETAKNTMDPAKSVKVPAGHATTVSPDGKPSTPFKIPAKIEWVD
jgi:hypothetical protein